MMKNMEETLGLGIDISEGRLLKGEEGARI